MSTGKSMYDSLSGPVLTYEKPKPIMTPSPAIPIFLLLPIPFSFSCDLIQSSSHITRLLDMAKQRTSKGGNGGGILISFFSFTNQLSSLQRERLIRGFTRGTCQAASIVPVEARRKARNGSFVAQEPGSPKISCMGRVEPKKKAPKPKSHKLEECKDHHEKNKKPSSSSSSSSRYLKNDPAPTLAQLKKFSNGRKSFANFDWKANGVLLNADLGKNRSRAFPNPLYESDVIGL